MNSPAAHCHCVIPTRPTWLEIDRNALINNINQIRRQIGPHPQLMAVIKANAYGHGAGAVATICQQAGVDYFGVATLNEALALRHRGMHLAILVLGYTPAGLAERLVKARITATVYDLETAHALAAAAHQAQTRAIVHVKVNTGMNRLGLPLEAVADFVRALHNFPTIAVEGIFTHFAEADQPGQDFAQVQLARFNEVLATLESAGLRPPLVHAANSAATLTLPAAHFDMVRCGIALYGLHPDQATAPLPPGFQPVLSWKARVAQVRALAPDEGIGYGRAFVTERPTITAMIPVGYGDGFPRAPHHWGSVLIHGQPAPILGRVCMDQTIVDVTAIEQAAAQAGKAGVRQGDEVVLIGCQGEATLTVEQIGARFGTINYEVVSRILARVPRVVV